MTLEDLGYNDALEKYRMEQNLRSFSVARVISEHRERYMVKTDHGEFEAEVVGNLRFSARDRTDFPAVGDWVAVSEYDEHKMLIHAILPRVTMLARTAVGTTGEKQIIASNIDYGLIIQAVDRDFNLNRIERYLAICYNSGITPVIVLTKIDLITGEDLKTLLDTIAKRIIDVPLIAISNKSKGGYDDLLKYIFKGKTYCLLGSSGVGKSTLVNNLSGRSLMKTDVISTSTNKGKHVTSHRELFLLDNGGILIDNPGMREVGIADAATGLKTAFDNIMNLSLDCKFKDCTHTHENGCAVLEALERREIDRDAYDNFLKMTKERAHFESSVEERREKDKSFGKILKDYKKFRKKNE